jgi:hypothetical protein
MNPLLVTWFERCRNLYDFPWARVCTVPLAAAEAPVTVLPGIDRYLQHRLAGVTDRALDAFHGDLLHGNAMPTGRY